MFLKLLKVLLLVMSFSKFSLGNFLSDSKIVSENLTTAVHSIIENVFLQLFTTANILTAVENSNDFYLNDFKQSLMAKNKGFDIYRLDNHTHIRTIRFRLKTYNAILLDSFKSFTELYENIVPEVFNFRGYFLFVLIHGKIPEIQDIFAKMWDKKIINVNVIFEEDKKVKLMTFTPFKKGYCRNTIPVHWGTYVGNGTFDIPFNQIFPDELKNLHGCKIKMAAFERCPASCLQSGKFTGFDVEIVGAIEEALNFKLEFVILEGAEQWGNIQGNETTGAIKKVVEGECDFTAGNFLLRSSRVAFMDPSVVYLSLPVIFAIPLGEKLTSFEKLLRPFELIVWSFILTFFSIGILVIFTINWKFKKLKSFVYGTGIETPIVNMMIAIFGGTQSKLPKRNFARFILMMFLLFCLVQRNVYQGLLYIFIKSDSRHKEVQSIKDMIDKKFEYYMYESYSDIVMNLAEIYEK
jgi:ABC-type amino acid transport substrate-binding protein